MWPAALHTASCSQEAETWQALQAAVLEVVCLPSLSSTWEHKALCRVARAHAKSPSSSEPRKAGEAVSDATLFPCLVYNR